MPKRVSISSSAAKEYERKVRFVKVNTEQNQKVAKAFNITSIPTLLVFVDGVGLAPAGPDNPLATAATPTLEAWLGGPLVAESVGRARPAVLGALDATLGVDGLPQSATGQTALFTGVNAAGEIGRHVSAFPGTRLRRLIRRHGLLGRLRAAGHEVAFANAYSKSYLERFESGAARRGWYW